MIVLNIRVETDQESIINLTKAITTMETATRSEAGCHDYAFSIELNDKNILRITERWENMAALQAHFKTPHMAVFNAALSTLRPTNVDMRCFDATEVAMPSSS